MSFYARQMLNRPGVTFGSSSSSHHHRQREVASGRSSSLSRHDDDDKGVRVNNDDNGRGGIPRFAAPRQRERLPVRIQKNNHHHHHHDDPNDKVTFQEHRNAAAAAEEGVHDDDDNDDNDAPIEGSLHPDGGLRDFSQVTLSQLSDAPSVRSFRSYRTTSSHRSSAGTTAVASAMRGGGGRVLVATNDGSDLLHTQHNCDRNHPREGAQRQGGGGGELNLPERRSVLAGQQQNLHQQQPGTSQHSQRHREDHHDTDLYIIRSSQPLLSQQHITAHRPASNGSFRKPTSSDGSKSNGIRKNDDNAQASRRRPTSSGSGGDRSHHSSRVEATMYEDDTSVNAHLLQQSQPLLSQLPNVSKLSSILPPKRQTTTTGERQIIPSQRDRVGGGSRTCDHQEQRQGVLSRLPSHDHPKKSVPTTSRYHQPYPSLSLGSTRHPSSVLGARTKAMRTSLARTLSTPSRAFRSMTNLAARTASSASGLIAMSPFRGIGAVTGREGFRTTIGATLTSAFAASKLSNLTSSSSSTAGGISMFTRPTAGSSILPSSIVSDRKSSTVAESLTVTTGTLVLPSSLNVSNGCQDTKPTGGIPDTFPPTAGERVDEGTCSMTNGDRPRNDSVEMAKPKSIMTSDKDHDDGEELTKTSSGLTFDIQSKTDEIIAATRELNYKHEQLEQSKQEWIDISDRACKEMKDERQRLEALQKLVDAKLKMMQSSIDAFLYKSASVTHDHELTIRTLVNNSMNDLRQESSRAIDAISNHVQERMKSQLPSDVRALIEVEARKYMVEVIDGTVNAAKSDFQVWMDGVRDSSLAAEKENVQRGGQNSPLSERKDIRSESLTPLPRDARSTSTTPFSRKATPLQNNHATGKISSTQSSTLVMRDIDFESSTHAEITACDRQALASATSTPSSALAKFVDNTEAPHNDQTHSHKQSSASCSSSSSSSKFSPRQSKLSLPEKKSRRSKSTGHITPQPIKSNSPLLTKNSNRSPKVGNASLPSVDDARKRSHSEVINLSNSPRRTKRLKETNRAEQFAVAQANGNPSENATHKPSQVTPKTNNTPINITARTKEEDASVSTSLICSPSSGVVGGEERRASISDDFDTLLGTSVTVPNCDNPDDDDIFDLEIDSDSTAAGVRPDKRSFNLFLPFCGFGNRNTSSRHKSSKTMSKKKKKREHGIDCFDFSERSD